MTPNETYPTIEEAIAHDRGWIARFGATNVFQDPATGGYYCDACDSYTTFSMRDGTSPTYEPMARAFADGTVELREKKLQPGDLEFWQGRISQVYGVGDPQYGVYETKTVQRGVRLPSFKKQCREQGYTIIREDATKRTAVARKVAG